MILLSLKADGVCPNTLVLESHFCPTPPHHEDVVPLFSRPVDHLVTVSSVSRTQLWHIVVHIERAILVKGVLGS